MKNLTLAQLEEERQKTVICVDDARVGEGFCVIAGPCTVENEKQIIETALAVKAAGANMMRAGLSSRGPLPMHSKGSASRGLKCSRRPRKSRACLSSPR